MIKIIAYTLAIANILLPIITQRIIDNHCKYMEKRIKELGW